LSESLIESPRKNRICNFRAPNDEWFKVWLDFEELTKNIGLDVCFVVLSVCKGLLTAFAKGNDVSNISPGRQLIFVCQKNDFNYNVAKPRRERFLMDCSRILPKCTICSMAFQAYIIEKARDLDRSFSFKDFPEINHELFRKLILLLKKSGKVHPLNSRTNPRFFILKEWIDRYPTMTKNTTVKPKCPAEEDETKSVKGGL
jgi:hypothetical protein